VDVAPALGVGVGVLWELRAGRELGAGVVEAVGRGVPLGLGAGEGVGTAEGLGASGVRVGVADGDGLGEALGGAVGAAAGEAAGAGVGAAVGVGVADAAPPPWALRSAGRTLRGRTMAAAAAVAVGSVMAVGIGCASWPGDWNGLGAAASGGELEDGAGLGVALPLEPPPGSRSRPE
jgi:hypothetical protein